MTAAWVTPKLERVFTVHNNNQTVCICRDREARTTLSRNVSFFSFFDELQRMIMFKSMHQEPGQFKLNFLYMYTSKAEVKSFKNITDPY